MVIELSSMKCQVDVIFHKCMYMYFISAPGVNAQFRSKVLMYCSMLCVGVDKIRKPKYSNHHDRSDLKPHMPIYYSILLYRYGHLKEFPF